MLLAGIDEAGRGPVIGPLVIAAVAIHKEDLHTLQALGVKDSKQLTPQKRQELAHQIRQTATHCQVHILSPHEIDRAVESKRKLHKLNRLEAKAMAHVIEILRPDIAYIDASDIRPDRFAEHIQENLTYTPKLICEHKADIKYPIVSAASIIAKVERDKAITRLQQKHGNIGCGYPSDPNTIKFLEQWIKKHGNYPDFVRKSWKTAKNLKQKLDPNQKKLH